MSITVMAMVWEHSQHKEGQLLAMLAIADFADDSGRAYPSMETLARKTRLTRRHIQRVVNVLETSSELKILRNQGPFGTHLFQINLSILRGVDIMSRGVDKAMSIDIMSRGRTFETQNRPQMSTYPSLEPSVREDKDNNSASLLFRRAGKKTPASPIWADSDLWLKHFLEDANENILTVITIPMDPKWWDSVSISCGGIDEVFLRIQFAKMQSWLIENPKRKPTPRGVKRFIRTWLERAHEHERRFKNG